MQAVFIWVMHVFILFELFRIRLAYSSSDLIRCFVIKNIQLFGARRHIHACSTTTYRPVQGLALVRPRPDPYCCCCCLQTDSEMANDSPLLKKNRQKKDCGCCSEEEGHACACESEENGRARSLLVLVGSKTNTNSTNIEIEIGQTRGEARLLPQNCAIEQVFVDELKHNEDQDHARPSSCTKQRKHSSRCVFVRFFSLLFYSPIMYRKSD